MLHCLLTKLRWEADMALQGISSGLPRELLPKGRWLSGVRDHIPHSPDLCFPGEQLHLTTAQTHSLSGSFQDQDDTVKSHLSLSPNSDGRKIIRDF